jgi:hypothetical protein
MVILIAAAAAASLAAVHSAWVPQPTYGAGQPVTWLPCNLIQPLGSAVVARDVCGEKLWAHCAGSGVLCSCALRDPRTHVVCRVQQV